MIEHFFQFIRGLGPWAYLVIFALVTLQASTVAGFLVPGETAAVLGGVLVASRVLDVRLVLALVFLASVCGNLVGYESGRRLQRAWLLRHGGRWLRGEHLERVDRFFARYGGAAVLLGRISPPLRALLPFVAGAARLPRRTMLFYTVVGGACWTAATVSLGYVAGKSWRAMSGYLSGGELAALLALLLLAGVLYLRWRRR